MNEKPARAIHPNQIFFKEIAVVIAEDNLHTVGKDTSDAEIELAGEIEAFLNGGDASEYVLRAIASYFDHTEELWENLWKNYVAHKAPQESSGSGFKNTRVE